MNNSSVFEGGCLCGAIRYRATGNPLGAGHCHCEQCRRHSGAVMATGVGFPAENIAWLTTEPTLYFESPAVARSFCPKCGSAVSFHWVDIGTIWMFIGSLDDPNSVRPDFHMFFEETISWMQIDDNLPRHEKFPETRLGVDGDESFPE